MEKTFKIDQKGQLFIYSEITTFPIEPFAEKIQKRNIQIVELIFESKESLEEFLAQKREEKETSKAQLSYSLVKTEDELKQLDALATKNGIKRFKPKI